MCLADHVLHEDQFERIGEYQDQDHHVNLEEENVGSVLASVVATVEKRKENIEEEKDVEMTDCKEEEEEEEVKHQADWRVLRPPVIDDEERDEIERKKKQSCLAEQTLIERRLKAYALEKRPVVGETWYLVNYNWFTKWLNMSVPNSPLLGMIDNSTLLSKDTCQPSHSNNSQKYQDLLPTIVENFHYTVVPLDVWQYLISIYGGGPEIERKIIQGPFSKPIVDLCIPISLNFVRSSLPSKIIKMTFQRETTISLMTEYGITMDTRNTMNFVLERYRI
eukprot:gene20047-24037_t